MTNQKNLNVASAEDLLYELAKRMEEQNRRLHDLERKVNTLYDQ